MKDQTLFQVCQKLVVFNNDDSKILLAKRIGEADYDGTYSFIGGKLETTDKGILEGIKREKNEEIGIEAILKVFPSVSVNAYFVKNSGQPMLLPHYYVQYQSGEIIPSDEYDDIKWVALEELNDFEPKIPNITDITYQLLSLKGMFSGKDFVQI